MYNVFITSHCNLKCSYCFAEDYMRSKAGSSHRGSGDLKVISIENYERILDYLTASEVSIVSLTGGEPTLHPDFFQIVELSLKKGFTVSIKSNATWNEETCNEIKNLPKDNIHFLLNVNHPSALGQHFWEKVSRNIRQLKGKWLDFQFNIYAQDFDYSYLLDLAAQAQPNRIVWSLSHMVKGSSSDSRLDPLAVRKDYSPRIVEFASAFHQLGIQTVGVHGITPCMFAEEDYQKLLSFGGSLEATCQPVFDFLPDLSVQFCFPMGGVFNKKYIQDYNHLQEINLEFLEKLVFMRSASFPLDECLECPYSNSLACHGGCLAHHLGRDENAINLDDVFFKQIPFLVEKFHIEGKEKNHSDEFLLIDEQLEQTYPLDQSLLAVLQAVDGHRTLGDLFEIVFSTYRDKETARANFKEAITQLLKRNVLALKPMKYSRKENRRIPIRSMRDEN